MSTETPNIGIPEKLMISQYTKTEFMVKNSKQSTNEFQFNLQNNKYKILTRNCVVTTVTRKHSK